MIDGFSALMAGWKAGNFIVDASRTDAVLSVVNDSNVPAAIALCLGAGNRSRSAGWGVIQPGQTYAFEGTVSRFGTDAIVYAENPDHGLTWGGDARFHVARGGGFEVKNARSNEPVIASGTGRLDVVGGHLIRVAGDCTYRITGGVPAWRLRRHADSGRPAEPPPFAGDSVRTGSGNDGKLVMSIAVMGVVGLILAAAVARFEDGTNLQAVYTIVTALLSAFAAYNFRPRTWASWPSCALAVITFLAAVAVSGTISAYFGSDGNDLNAELAAIFVVFYAVWGVSHFYRRTRLHRRRR